MYNGGPTISVSDTLDLRSCGHVIVDVYVIMLICMWLCMHNYIITNKYRFMPHIACSVGIFHLAPLSGSNLLLLRCPCWCLSSAKIGASMLSVRASPSPCKNGIVHRAGKSITQMPLRGHEMTAGVFSSPVDVYSHFIHCCIRDKI